MVQRLINLPLSQPNYHKEIKMIKQIAVNSGYQPNIMDKPIKKKLNKKAIHSLYPKVRTKNRINYLYLKLCVIPLQSN